MRHDQPVFDDGLHEDVPAGLHAREAMREIDQEIAARLASLELLDPSQERPTPRPNRLGRVDYIEL